MAYLVEVGGEVRVGEPKPSGEPWRVAVEAPVAGERSVYAALALLQQGIATSGDYRATQVMDGERYAHIIDPRTGRAILQRGFSVSVVHERTLVADAWATALVVLGPDEGFALAARSGIAALFLTVENGQVRERATAGFPALILTGG
jgi:thiamine biosynthesis lipoprotein